MAAIDEATEPHDDALIEKLLGSATDYDGYEDARARLAARSRDLAADLAAVATREGVGSWELAARCRDLDRLATRFAAAGFTPAQADRVVNGLVRTFRLGSYQTGLYESAVPQEITRFGRLEHFDAYNNHLTEWPAVLASLPSLRVVLLDHNALTELPASVTSLPQLVELSVTANPLVRLSPALLEAPRLRILRLWTGSLDEASRQVLSRLARKGRLEVSASDATCESASPSATDGEYVGGVARALAAAAPGSAPQVRSKPRRSRR